MEEKAQGLFAGKFETNSGRPFAGFFTVKWVPVLGAACSNAGRWHGKQSVKKISVRDQIERVAGRSAAETVGRSEGVGGSLAVGTSVVE